jgi:site-specific recombinase XerD
MTLIRKTGNNHRNMPYRELPTVEEMSAVFHEWLVWLPLYEDKPPHTVRAYGQGVRRVVSFADISPAGFRADSLDQATLTDTVRAMRAAPDVSKSTINQTLAALKSFFDYCVADGLVTVVPDIARIRKVAKLDVPQVDPEYYRPPEIRDLYEEARSWPVSQDNGSPRGSRVRWPARDLAMCSFLTVLGLRSAEILSADVGWITRERLVDADDRATWMLHVVGKGRRIRRLPLSDELVDVNDRWQAERAERFGPSGATAPLFATNSGDRFTYQRLRYWLKLLNREAGLRDRSLHSLRHTAGVQLASEGVPMNVIQSLLGHATITTTGIYTELAGGQLVGVLEQSGANTLLAEALSAQNPPVGS